MLFRSRQSPAPGGRLESFAHHCEGVYHHAAEARMTRSLGEAWALDDDHRGRVGDHTAHGFLYRSRRSPRPSRLGGDLGL